MSHSSRVSAPRWLVPTLVLFLVLGHICELPAYGEFALQATEAAHHAAGDHADEHLTPCDPAVAVPSSTGYLQVGPTLGVAESLAVAELVPAPLDSSSREDSRTPPSRPPLFLLHASLLI